MSWSLLSEQFSLELGFGVLFALSFVPRAPVGSLFYRIAGTAACLPIGIALALRIRRGAEWSDPALLGEALAVAAFPVYSGPLRRARWGAGLALALLGTALAINRVVRQGVPPLGGPGLALASASALVTGAVAGAVGLAMVLGHWYLTVPRLEIRHLQRLNRAAAGAMLASIALCLSSCLVFADELRSTDPPLFGPTGLFYLCTRLAVGLLLPLAFAAMAASALRFRNTRSATGILYASTVLVLIGTAVSVFLQDSYRVPL